MSLRGPRSADEAQEATMMDSYDLQNTLQHERLDAYAVAVALDGASAPSPPKDIHEGVPALGQLVGPGPAVGGLHAAGRRDVREHRV